VYRPQAGAARLCAALDHEMPSPVAKSGEYQNAGYTRKNPTLHYFPLLPL